jgi:ferredoxin
MARPTPCATAAAALASRLRTGEYFHTATLVRSNYISHVDPEKCVACGECVEVCPMNALRLGERLENKTEIKVEEPLHAFDHKWGPDKWNPDFRFDRQLIMNETGTAPCKVACPAHISIEGYIELAKEGRYAKPWSSSRTRTRSRPSADVSATSAAKMPAPVARSAKRSRSRSMKSRSSSLSSIWMRIRALSRASSIRNTMTTRWPSSARARRAYLRLLSRRDGLQRHRVRKRAEARRHADLGHSFLPS